MISYLVQREKEERREIRKSNWKKVAIVVFYSNSSFARTIYNIQELTKRNTQIHRLTAIDSRE